MMLHAFADDTQLYLHCRLNDASSTAVRQLRFEHCLKEVAQLATGCLAIGLNYMWTKHSCSELDPGIVIRFWVTAARLWSLE